MRKHPDGSYDDEELVREGGVLVPRSGGQEIGPDEDDLGGSEYVIDPTADDGVPGTEDDLPYDYGVELPEAADHLIAGPDDVNAGFDDMGRTGPADEDRDEPALGGPEERELWKKQRPLIEEAATEEGHVAGLEELDQEQLRDSEAEGAEETLPDHPEGTSATGAA